MHDALPDDASAFFDAMTRFWLSPGGPCRHEVNRFCNGTPRSELSQFAQQELAKLFFIPVVE
eukprot:639881-Alexandrium_andersonii.AAC.1